MASNPLGASGPVIPMIESQELAFCINSKKKILLVDSRSLLEYNNKCILNAINVSCSKLLKRRLQQDKMSVTELLQVENPREPVSTDPCTPVVVYDQCSEHPESLSSDQFVYILLRKLANHYREVSLLKGGIVEFQTHFGALCERRNLLPLDLAPRPTPLSPDHAGVDAVDGYAAAQRSPPFLTAMSVPVCNIGPTRVLDHLYLGSQTDAMDADVLRVNGITHVLNVSNNPKTPHVADTSFFRIDVKDDHEDEMLPHFQKGFLFLEKVRQAGGRALVHCLAGISRSPTLAIAYLMQFMHMSSDEAYRYVKERRANIAPNFNFLGQLLEFELELRARRQASDSPALTPEVSPLPMAVASASSSAASTPQLVPYLPPFAGRPVTLLPCSSRPPSLLPSASTSKTSSPKPSTLSFSNVRPPSTLSFSTSASTTVSSRPPSLLPCSSGSTTASSSSSSSSSSSASSRPPAALSSSSRPPVPSTSRPPSSLFSSSRPSRPPALASEGSLKKKRPCLNRPSHLPAEKTAKTSALGCTGSPPAAKKPPVSPMYECLLGQARQTRTAPPPASLPFGLRPVRPPRQARLELPRSATVGQIASPTTALARLSFDNMSQLTAFPTTSLEKLSFMPCHSAMDRGPPQEAENAGQLPRSKSAVENLGRPAARPLWLNFGPPATSGPATADPSASGRLRSPLTPRKQLGAMSPVAEPEAGRKSRSLEDMLEGLVPAPAGSCQAPEGAGGRRTRGEGPCRLLDHSLHQSSSSLSSSAASGSQHSSMHSSMEILQCS